MRPKLWLVAGPNGAGKSTLVQTVPIQRVLPDVTILNPDVVARELLRARGLGGFADATPDEQRQSFLEAAEKVASMLDEYVASCKPVGVETVLSTDKYKALVERVLSANGFVGLIYVFLRSSDLAYQRAIQRVLEGGHAVPEDKVRSRWRRSLANLAWFASRSSQFFVFDNSDSNPDHPPLLVAYGVNGKIKKFLANPDPELANALPH